MLKKLVVFTMLCAMLACSPQQRLNRLLRKHPELAKIDSVTIQDTFYLTGTKGDTVYLYNPESDKADTFWLKDPRFETSVIITPNKNKKAHKGKGFDTIAIKTVIPDDTLVKKVIVPVLNVQADHGWCKWRWISLGLFILVIFFVFKMLSNGRPSN